MQERRRKRDKKIPAPPPTMYYYYVQYVEEDAISSVGAMTMTRGETTANDRLPPSPSHHQKESLPIVIGATSALARLGPISCQLGLCYGLFLPFFYLIVRL